MKKGPAILIGIIAVLVVIIGITGFMNKDHVAEMKDLNNDAIFIVMDEGQEKASYNMTQIKEMGETEFKANLKTSGKDPIPYTYTGVLLKTILQESGVNLSGMEAVIVTAADGYMVAVDIDKVMADDNVYLGYMRDGVLIGTREEGGKGPYQMVISKDPFSQFWCKYALSVEVK
jgi:hypothetical protein